MSAGELAVKPGTMTLFEGDFGINPRADGSPVRVDVQIQHAIGDLKRLAE